MRRDIVCVVAPCILIFSASTGRPSLENPDLNEYYHLGRFYIDTGQNEKAITNFSAMIARHPNTKQAERGWLLMGECYRRLMANAKAELENAKARAGVTKKEVQEQESKINSFMNEALAAYRKAGSQFPAAKAEAIIGIGQTLAAYGTEKADEARTEFARVIEGFPEESARALLLSGDLELSLDNPEGAEEAYRRAFLSFPEVASLAMLKYADGDYRAENFGKASDGYQEIITSLGIDGAYDCDYHPLGSVMRDAIEKKGQVERALKNKDEELKGYATVAARHHGTNAGMTAQLATARALCYYGRSSEGIALLRGIASDYPKSVWAVRALFTLAEQQGDSPDAVETLRKIAGAYPQSIFRVEAQMKLAAVYLTLAGMEKDQDKKDAMRAQAREACDTVLRDYPLCPETDEAKDFIQRNKL